MAEENGSVGQNRAWRVIKHLLGVEDGKGALRAVLEPLAIIAITFASTTAIAQPFYVPSGSMQPTLASAMRSLPQNIPMATAATRSRSVRSCIFNPASAKIASAGRRCRLPPPARSQPDLYQTRDRTPGRQNSDDRGDAFGSTASELAVRAPTAREKVEERRRKRSRDLPLPFIETLPHGKKPIRSTKWILDGTTPG